MWISLSDGGGRRERRRKHRKRHQMGGHFFRHAADIKLAPGGGGMEDLRKGPAMHGRKSVRVLRGSVGSL